MSTLLWKSFPHHRRNKQSMRQTTITSNNVSPTKRPFHHHQQNHHGKRRWMIVTILWGISCALGISVTFFLYWTRESISICSLDPSRCDSFTTLPQNNRSTDDVLEVIQRKQSRIVEERKFPRVVLFVEANWTRTEYEKNLNERRQSSSQRIVPYLGNHKAQLQIIKDDYLTLDPPETKKCKLKYEWQKSMHPTCNSIHEFDPTTPWNTYDNYYHRKYFIVGNGYWRDVWIVNYNNNYNDNTEQQQRVVFKSMRYEHEYTLRNYDRMRRDALSMERLSASSFIIDIYSFCGTSSISEYGDGGDIPSALWPDDGQPNLSQIEKLRIATQSAMSLAAVHNVDEEGKATIAHTDIAPGQFIKVGDRYKLNDFNRARFLTYSTKDDTLCKYYVGSNPGRFRSPEEYNYEPQTESVDVYSLGNIFYLLLQEEWPFDDVSLIQARKLVKKGHRPSIYIDLWNSTDPVNQVLKEAMIMCHEQSATKRATARQVETYLIEKMRQMDPVFLNELGIVA